MTAELSIPSSPFNRRAIPADAKEAWWAAPDGHSIRRIDWPAPDEKPRGSLLFMPGRSDHYEKYLETLDLWHGQGWRVTSADWRGQGFSGDPGCDEFTGSVKAYSCWLEDLSEFWRQWTEITPGPHVIIAHSMGAHIVLRALAERRFDPDAAVLIAPMLGFNVARLPLVVLQFVARLMIKLRGRHRPAWKGSEKPGGVLENRMDLLTHDRGRYEDELWWRRERPDLEMCAPSWGWFDESIASMRYLRRPGVLEAIRQPVLVLATMYDRLVDYRAMRWAAERIGGARLVDFGAEARHELLRECDEVRDRALAEIEGFLDREAPANG